MTHTQIGQYAQIYCASRFYMGNGFKINIPKFEVSSVSGSDSTKSLKFGCYARPGRISNRPPSPPVTLYQVVFYLFPVSLAGPSNFLGLLVGLERHFVSIWPIIYQSDSYFPLCSTQPKPKQYNLCLSYNGLCSVCVICHTSWFK